MLDFRYILSVYLNRQYAYMKNVRLCANMFLKGLFTSDIDYQPGISASEARKLGLLDQGISPMPRDMAFHLPKGADWLLLYDYIKFPPDSKVAQFGIIANVKSTLRQSKADTVHGSSHEESSHHQDKRIKLNRAKHVGIQGKSHQEIYGNIHAREDAKVMTIYCAVPEKSIPTTLVIGNSKGMWGSQNSKFLKESMKQTGISGGVVVGGGG